MKKAILSASLLVVAFTFSHHTFAADLEPVEQPAAVEEKKFLIPGDFSSSIGLFTDYRFRGLSQTDRGPAVQGTIDYSIDTFIDGVSLYLGVFGSNINFTPGLGIDDGSVEFDYYGGFSGKFKKIGWSVGAYYYNYPDAESSLNQDYVEAALSLDYNIIDPLTVGINYFVSPDFFGSIGVAHYIEGTASYELPFFEIVPLTLDGSIGYQAFAETSDDYLTWKVGLSAKLHEHLSVGVEYIDTNTSLAFSPGGADIADATVVGNVKVSF